MDSCISWLLGIIVGDGYVSRYFVEISDQYCENLLIVKKCVEVLGYKAVISKDRRENRYRLWINSKRFVEYVCSLGVKQSSIPSYVVAGGLQEKLRFIQGLFDAEGYIEFWKPRRSIRINFANKDRDLICFVSNMLRLLGIKTYVRFSSKVYRLQIYSKRDISAYMKYVGFAYPTKIRRYQALLKLINGARPRGGGLKLKGIGGGAPQGVEPAV